MGASPLFPFIVMLFLFGVIAISKNYSLNTPAAQSIKASQLNNEAEAYLAYRDAVSLYIEANPTFTGTITHDDLIARGAPKTLNVANNNVVDIGSNKRLVMVYASLTPSAIAYAYSLSDYDASLGVASAANTWTSITPSSVSYPLPATIPKGALVWVIAVGG